MSVRVSILQRSCEEGRVPIGIDVSVSISPTSPVLAPVIRRTHPTHPILNLRRRPRKVFWYSPVLSARESASGREERDNVTPHFPLSSSVPRASGEFRPLSIWVLGLFRRFGFRPSAHPSTLPSVRKAGRAVPWTVTAYAHPGPSRMPSVPPRIQACSPIRRRAVERYSDYRLQSARAIPDVLSLPRIESTVSHPHSS